jgi:hypothetical protein
MSGLLGAILQAGGGQAIQMIGGRFGLSPSQTQAALSALAPMIAGGFKQQAQANGGLESMLGAVLNPHQMAVADDVSELARPGAVTAPGNEVLGAIFGSRDVSRQVAAQAAQKTGLSPDILKQMLPVVAMLAAGSMAKNANAGGLGNLIAGAVGGQAASALVGGGGAGALGAIASMIDMDKDGNPLDDIMGMLGKR